MKEADFQTKFSRWVKNVYKKTGAFELKICHEKSLPFSAVAPHQIAALYQSKHGAMFHKIADGGYSQLPFDCFMLAGESAWVVVMFYKRGQKDFYMIDIDVFIKEMETSARRSLTEERAAEIGQKCTLGSQA